MKTRQVYITLADDSVLRLRIETRTRTYCGNFNGYNVRICADKGFYGVFHGRQWHGHETLALRRDNAWKDGQDCLFSMEAALRALLRCIHAHDWADVVERIFWTEQEQFEVTVNRDDFRQIALQAENGDTIVSASWPTLDAWMRKR